ncbi:MAG: acetate kinase [Gammaproteobacteria bacterium]|nr:acetate kinase [Gammaproteobacteria bacterium]
MNSILILNCGSSSIKFAVIEAENKSTIVSGLAERLGQEKAVITFKENGNKTVSEITNAQHEEALAFIVEKLGENNNFTIAAVGHRVVHGGELFSKSCIIDDEVLAGITECNSLAPLHNPANIAGIVAAKKSYPTLPHVAVFDTAFHQTMPEENYLYAVPHSYYRDYGLRRYGFHGTSYRYIARTLSEHSNGQIPEKVIVAHLGNGASVCAIKDGKSFATSMGITPLDGLVQGTRSGAIDPAIVSFLADKTGKPEVEITNELWKKSGLLGLSEQTNDCRELEENAAAGDKNCIRALDIFINRLKETIGAYAALMNGVDALVFTGGIGENSDYIRAQTIEGLGYLGFAIDKEKNTVAIRGNEGNVAIENTLPVWVIPTDEELMICEDTLALM